LARFPTTGHEGRGLPVDGARSFHDEAVPTIDKCGQIPGDSLKGCHGVATVSVWIRFWVRLDGGEFQFVLHFDNTHLISGSISSGS
jgi:hypothetical protein